MKWESEHWNDNYLSPSYPISPTSAYPSPRRQPNTAMRRERDMTTKNIYIILVYILNINLPVHRIEKTSTRGPRHYNRSFNLNSIAPNYDSVAPDMASLQQLLRQNSNLQQTQRNLIGYRQLTYHNDINYSLSTVPLRRKQGHWCSDTLI